MSVELEDVDYVARLAKLHLSAAERRGMTAQLNRILEYIEQLRGLDVEQVPPTKHVIEMTNVDRADEPTACLEREVVLSQAPESADGHFVVPRILPG